MAHSPLFDSMRRALRLARVSRHSGMDAPELLQRQAELITRRQFMQVAALGSAALVGGVLSSCASTPVDTDAKTAKQPRIAIIGAGLAGLNCAYQLKKAGIRATIYEAAQRVGGRCFSKRDILGKGLTTEIGGEFVDSGCADMLALVKEFELPLLDVTQDINVTQEAYYIGGRHYTEAEVIEALEPFVERMGLDASLVPQEPKKPSAIEFMVRRSKTRKKYDAMPLSEYLDEKEIKGWLRALLEAAFVTEFGMDASEQSSLNFLSMIGTDTSEGLKLLGESDERYKVEGGNQRVIEALSKGLEGQIETDRKLIRVQKRNGAMVAYFEKGDTEADILVFALPFTMLREVDLYLDLPPEKVKAIAELGYGMNAKVMFGTNSRPWRKLGYSGNVFSDEPFQLAWDNTRMQQSGAGGITFYSGGRAATKLGEGTPRQALDKLMPGLEKAFPGVTQEFNGHFQRMHWPTQPFTKASYSAYKVGQWTTIRGHEFEPAGDVHFCGEHTSLEHQGFLNGAVETGRRVAEAIISQVKK